MINPGAKEEGSKVGEAKNKPQVGKRPKLDLYDPDKPLTTR
jgi:hypothetical protein